MVIRETGEDPETVDRSIRDGNARADAGPALVFDSDPRQTANNGAAQAVQAADQAQEDQQGGAPGEKVVPPKGGAK